MHRFQSMCTEQLSERVCLVPCQSQLSGVSTISNHIQLSCAGMALGSQLSCDAVYHSPECLHTSAPSVGCPTFQEHLGVFPNLFLPVPFVFVIHNFIE